MLPEITRRSAGRYMAVVVCVGLIFSYWCAHSLLVYGQAGNALASENGDVNGDGRRDLADAVYYLSWLFEGGSPPVACAAPADEDVEFGRRIAGTYYGTAETGGPFLDVITINADGTYTGSNTNGDPTDGFASTEHGVWERVGEREIASTSLLFSFDGDGVQTSIFRVRATGSFSEDFQTENVTFTIDVFLPDQDPLSDEPVQTIPGTAELRRMGVISE